LEDEMDEYVSESINPIRMLEIKDSDMKRHVRFVAPEK
jgi:hypothetical protein